MIRHIFEISNAKSLLFKFLIIALSCSLQAEDDFRSWSLKDGTQFTAEFTIELAGKAYFHDEKHQVWIIPVSQLVDDQQTWVKQHADQGKEPIKWSESSSRMAGAVQERCKILDDSGELVDFDTGERNEPEFYVFFFGAEWNKGSRYFAKNLKQWYDEFHRHGVRNYEVFYVSDDKNYSKYETFIKSNEMRWPVIAWIRTYPRSINRLEGKRKPTVVITDREGNKLSETLYGDTYRSADTVLEDLKELVYRTNPNNPVTLLKYFDNILERHLNNSIGKDAQPSPVYMFVDSATRRRWGNLKTVLQLKISPTGNVIESQILETNRPDLALELRSTLQKWRFLPKITSGTPVESIVKIPFDIEIDG